MMEEEVMEEEVAEQGSPEFPAAKPLVAIIGRPNVGKSSLFNAILGRRTAIVAEEAGTTRDRMIADVEFEGHRFMLADTGGLVPEPETEIEAHISAQVDAAIDGRMPSCSSRTRAQARPTAMSMSLSVCDALASRSFWR